MTYLWESLTYEHILNTVEKTVGYKLSNLCLRRNSYINRVFELEKADPGERLIVKFYRPQRWTVEMIQTEHNFVQELHAQDVPVIPPLSIGSRTIFFLEHIPFALYPKKGGRSIDEFDKEGWLNIGRLLAKLHCVGAKQANAPRLLWTPETATRRQLQVLLQGNYLPADFQKSFQNIVELFIKKTEPLFKNTEKILLHGDCHRGNLIYRPGEGIFIVDFDDICIGSPVQDLWMLLPGHLEEAEQEFTWFLEGYQTFRDFDLKSLQLIPALRAMRLIHFAAWCAVQSHDPDFAEHFPEWGTLKYWNTLIKDIQQTVYENN